MAGEPEISIGGPLSTSECRKARPGTLFSFMRNAAHALQHDYGDPIVVKRLTLRDNKDAWEAGLSANGLRLCQAAGQTDWQRGGLLRFVAKDRAAVAPQTNFLGLENIYVTIHSAGSIDVSNPTVVYYRYNPGNPFPFLDPNTYPYFGGYTQWQILRGSSNAIIEGAYAPVDGGGTYKFKIDSTGVGEVLFSGGFAGNFPTGVPATETWSDSSFSYTFTLISGEIKPILFPMTRLTVVDYSFKVF